MTEPAKPRAVGLNHIALEVGDIEEALAFYGRLFRFELRGKSDTMAFIDLGDQFIALQKGRRQPADDGRHFGLVVDDRDAARRALRDVFVAAYAALTQRARGCEAELRILGAWGDGCHLVCFAGGHRRSVPPDAHLNLEGGDQRVFRVNDNASRFPMNFKADRKLHLGALPLQPR
jgi:catechol 2,3-dioxygenase-like lactoylglutathione lyase family enzyme